ncbi:alpha/beta fold hydrolase [Actinobacteria bacterium YIM 96077]|uniref:AB hydrolase-1 domain-containing protein n=1 Tax=Phytoactinopolyspora halophila TaxID=1981511 RepID=A0A329QPA6_9ACTN|nr:alpha/beta hydrolase [Phytoactinopolyspora halophila]AYY15027.1 alpha/beta fold hydrolase [Actinobacteria bacterium YIM 96077]RAW14207.1 hypothetical protein DPM12_11155 [Phytoactinopolyspora halophila]
MQITFAQAGEGPPLVLLRGTTSDSRAWQPQLEGLSDEFTVVAWDGPRLNGSSRSESLRPSACVDYLAGFIRTLGLGRPHVLGLASGTALALELYRRYPDVPQSLVLAEAELPAGLPAIDIPTLLLYGDRNGRTPLDTARNLHARIPVSQLAVLPGLGKNGHVKAPDVFNAEVRSFLRSVRN